MLRPAALRIVALAAALVVTRVAAAQPIDETTKNAARSLAAEGDDLFAHGQYAEAADRFERASALVPAPTLGVRWARALARTGKLIEAEERYVAVVRTELPPSAPEPFRTAVAEATTELEALRPRIPRLEISRAAGIGDVTLDGRAVPAALLGVERPVNPGKHVIEAEGSASRTVILAEGERARVDLQATAGGGVAAPDAASGQRTAGWVALGIGGVGLVVGVVGGAVALGKNGDLGDACDPSGACPKSAQGDIDAFETAGTVSTVGFVIAGVGLAAGAFLLLTSPSSASATGRAQRPRLVFSF